MHVAAYFLCRILTAYIPIPPSAFDCTFKPFLHFQWELFLVPALEHGKGEQNLQA